MNLFNKNLEWFKQSHLNQDIKITLEEPVSSLTNCCGDRKQTSYHYVVIESKSKNIKLGFTSPHNENAMNASYYQIRNLIAIDTFKDFDKWSKCPFVIEFPASKSEFNNLLEALKLIGQHLDDLDEDIPEHQEILNKIYSLINPHKYID